MIRSVRGNLLAAQADALVNTVNTVGVMGKGIALEFKRAFPGNFTAYADACQRGELVVGRMLTHRVATLTGSRLIVNFPTKRHWRHPSRLSYVQAGLVSLRAVVAREGLVSIAIPPLGCGNGGLDWARVRPLIVAAFADLPGVDVQLFEPAR